MAEVTARRHCFIAFNGLDSDHSLTSPVSFTAPHYSFTLHILLLLTAAAKWGRIYSVRRTAIFFVCGQRYSEKEKIVWFEVTDGCGVTAQCTWLWITLLYIKPRVVSVFAALQYQHNVATSTVVVYWWGSVREFHNLCDSLNVEINSRVPTLLLTKKFQDFPGPQNVFPRLRRSPAMLNCRKQQQPTLYVQCDSTIHHKTFVTSCKETVRLAQQEYFIRLFTHGVLYIKGMLVKLNHSFKDLTYYFRTFQDQTHFPGPGNFRK